MNVKSVRQANMRKVHGVYATILTLGCVAAASAYAKTQKVTPPTTPGAITPPAGNSAFLSGHAVGTQGYICLPASIGASNVSWTVDAPRPEATLFDNSFKRNVGTHFLSPNTNPNKLAAKPVPFGSPTWQSSVDSTKIWGQRLTSIPAGSDKSCPNTGSIDCLLLQATGSDAGSSGGKSLTKTTFIQRLNTKGGSAPATGCSVLSDVGKQILVPYTADYYFFRGDD